MGRRVRGRDGVLKHLASGGARLREALRPHVMTGAICFTIGSLFAGGVAWAAYTVHDPVAHASRLEQLNEAIKQLEISEEQLGTALEQLQTLQDQVNQLMSINGVLGELGPLAGSSLETGPFETLGRLACQRPDFSGWGLSPDFSIPNFGSICAAKDFVTDTLGKPEGEEGTAPTSEALRELASRRAAAVQQASLHGLSMALSEREAAQASTARLQQTAATGNAAADLRADVQNLRAIAVQQTEELIQIRAALGSLVEVMSSQALEQLPISWGASAGPSARAGE